MTADSDDQRLREIIAWFLERDILLGFDPNPEGASDVLAVMVPADSRIAPVRFGNGKTKLEAAEDAKRRYEAGELTWPVGVSLSMSYEIHAADTGTATENASVTKDEDVAELAQIATDYGWQIGFKEQPDGSVIVYLMDENTGEVLKSALGEDFHDAVLEVMKDTYPPSREGRSR